MSPDDPKLVRIAAEEVAAYLLPEERRMLDGLLVAMDMIWDRGAQDQSVWNQIRLLTTIGQLRTVKG